MHLASVSILCQQLKARLDSRSAFSLWWRGNASFYLTFTLNPALTSFVLHPKLSLVLLQYDFRVAFLSPRRKFVIKCKMSRALTWLAIFWGYSLTLELQPFWEGSVPN